MSNICRLEPLKWEDLLLFFARNDNNWRRTAGWTKQAIRRHHFGLWEIIMSLFPQFLTCYRINEALSRAHISAKAPPLSFSQAFLYLTALYHSIFKTMHNILTIISAQQIADLRYQPPKYARSSLFPIKIHTLFPDEITEMSGKKTPSHNVEESEKTFLDPSQMLIGSILAQIPISIQVSWKPVQ